MLGLKAKQQNVKKEVSLQLRSVSRNWRKQITLLTGLKPPAEFLLLYKVTQALGYG